MDSGEPYKDGQGAPELEGPQVHIVPPTVKQARDPRKDATWTLMPPADPTACSQCGRDHDPGWPHDAQSLHYQYAFYSEHDRWPTWEDAMSHCSESMQAQWREALAEHGVKVEMKAARERDGQS